jgi:cytochrome c5
MYGNFAMHRKKTMLKTTLIAALFALAGLSVQAQTNAAATGTAKAAAPAASAPAAKAAPAAASVAAPAASAAKAEAEPEVKKSNAGICHDKTSPGFKQTKNFTAFKTMDECIKSGGRAPKK